MSGSVDSRLLGPPVRYSPAPASVPPVHYDGFVKLRLGHAAFGSLLLPELIFLRLGGWRYYQPSFFGPPMLSFNVEPDLHIAHFAVDVGGPREANPARLTIELRSDGLVRGFDDGAQLYRCVIRGPSRMLQYAGGRCRPRSDDDFDVSLFHITNPKAFAGIRADGELRSSCWNLQGTRELANVAYVYLTSLPSIETEEDLRRIAMSSDAVIRLQTTSSFARESMLELKVYRENTTGRTARLPVGVASDLLSPPHILIHRPLGDQAYYEVVGPEIYRVGVLPGTALTYAAGAARVDAGLVKRFDYLVLGDASTLSGIAAPYDEEDTDEVIHVERLVSGTDLFDFWQANRNSDQVSWRDPEPRAFSS